MKSCGLIARVQAKLLFRSGLGRFFFILISACILFHVGFNLSALNPAKGSGEVHMASLFPYTIAFLFTLSQYPVLIFLSASFFSRKKIDTLDSIKARPASNAEYYTGVGIGFVRVFVAWAIVLFSLGMLVHVFASKAPFNPWLYPYYLVTLVFPATVFMLGLSFFILSLLRQSFVSMIILFACVWGTVSLSGESFSGILNFSGLTLPNEYSEITGFADVYPYLLQGLGWLLAGVGLFFFSILFCRRLENRPGERVATGKKAGGILLLGLACLLAVQGIYSRKYARRARYAEVYDRHVNHDRLYLLTQELYVTPAGRRLKGLSRMKLLNETGKVLPDFLLYLNPGLRVKSLTVGDDTVTFRHEDQVIVVGKSVLPGDTLRVEMEYEGGIDENIFYLDVPEEELKDSWVEGHPRDLCPRGKRYAYLDEHQVLLNPEGLWYPVTVPPVNPASPYVIEKNFTGYRLTVHGVKGQTVISQGERRDTGEGVVFENNYPLTGISLCVGDYERRYLRLDSVDYELFLFKGHGIFVEAYEDVLNDLPGYFSGNLKPSIERDFNKEYPFKRLLFIETPRTFVTYYRDQRGGSEYVQPEIIFFPERMPTPWMDRWALIRKGKEFAEYFTGGEKGVKLDMIQSIYTNYLEREIRPVYYPRLKRAIDRLTFRPSKPARVNNLFFTGPLFYNHVYSFHSLDYPVIETVFNTMVKNSFNPAAAAFSFISLENYREGIRFLSTRGLKDVSRYPGLSPELTRRLVNIKTDELLSLLDLHGVPTGKLAGYLREYVSRRHFNRVDLKELDRDMRRDLGINLLDILPGWYQQNRLPSFIVKDIDARRVSPDGPYYSGNDVTRFVFTVYNDSETDGFVTLSYFSELYARLPSNYHYRIPAGEGRRISHVARGKCSEPVLKLNLSRNYPPDIPLEEFFSSVASVDTVNREEKIGKGDLFPPGEIIVDDMDAGFSCGSCGLSLVKRWKRERQEEAVHEKDIIYFDRLNPDWQTRIDQTAHGYPTRTTMARLVLNSGNGVSWSAGIDREGYYEISVYIPPGLIKYTGSHVKSDNTAKPSFSQYYTVESDGELKETSIEISGQPGWVSIGKFYCVPGTTRVSLLDKGIPGQLIWADAVRWKYLGGKDEQVTGRAPR